MMSIDLGELIVPAAVFGLAAFGAGKISGARNRTSLMLGAAGAVAGGAVAASAANGTGRAAKLLDRIDVTRDDLVAAAAQGGVSGG